MLISQQACATAVGSADDICRAGEALNRLGQELGGFRVAVWANLASKDPMRDAQGNILAESIFGWTDADRPWWKSADMALTSPVSAACRFEAEPFWCNKTGFFGLRNRRLLPRIDLSNFERRAMMSAGIIVPIHLPFGQIGMASFTHKNPETDDLGPLFDAYSCELGVCARTFVASYVRVTAQRSRLPPDTSLNLREAEILRWASIGKTDIEIGMILNRTRATVRFHLHNASVKLNAVNRSQTVFKAAQLGYITINP